MKPLVYVASPYTKGDSTINTHFQCKVFDRLLTDDLVIPFVPLWSHFQHVVFPRDYRDWIDYDLQLIRAANFQACLRLDAEFPELDYKITESVGADGEVRLFRELNKPVYYSIDDLYAAVLGGEWGEVDQSKVKLFDERLLFWPE